MANNKAFLSFEGIKKRIHNIHSPKKPVFSQKQAFLYTIYVYKKG